MEVWQERGVAEREQATFLDLLAARKILEEERAHLSELNYTLKFASMLLTKPPCCAQIPRRGVCAPQLELVA